ncbi:metallophosphoesterase [Limimaricola litoreus]|uniref:Metallophosphoesterase n=1 Tax=Limimaricola litoreus TaxID=2955316 RepID=A0A9X2FXM7_9RHOB|nr:metallophosphoesterase [Limimaricola litoreus]MCP1169023.1 metallophosphoesterase [Limimaricola litoreus]
MIDALDVIPDIHADVDRLKLSLAQCTAKVGFLGDFIDAGKACRMPDDRAVLQRVRGLVEGGRAVAVMGNHELNAILFHRTGIDGTPLRAHSEKNRAQHRSFVQQVGVASEEALDWTDWFLTLPLWLDLGSLRLVHAYWSDTDIAEVAARRPDGRLAEEDLYEIAAESTEFGRAVNRLTSGPEIQLPAGYAFRDLGEHERTQMRLAWWRTDAKTWRDAALSVPNPSDLPDTPLPQERGAEIYSADAPPVLMGHYKMKGRPQIETSNAACLDYPETPVVMKFRGETDLRSVKLVECETSEDCLP